MKKIIDWFKNEFLTKETLDYLFVGLGSTALNWTATYLLNRFLKLGYWPTSVITFIMSSLFTYYMNKKFTFKNDNSWKEVLPKYVAEVLICFVVSYGLGKAVLDWFFTRVFVPDWEAHTVDTVKGILANCCYIALNYIGQKFFVFKTKHTED